MKKIECIIKPERLEKLKDALLQEGIGGMTVSEVKGFGNEQSRPDSYLFLPKTKVEIYCQDEVVDSLIQAICLVCQTGKLGDGKIAVSEIQELVRIRTFEKGAVAV